MGMEINTVIKRLLNESEALEAAFTSLHIETIKMEKEVAGAVNKQEMGKARHQYKLLQKIKFEVGELLECLGRLKNDIEIANDFENHYQNTF